MDCDLPGSSVHRILQAKILSGLPFPFPEDLPDPGIKAPISYVSCIDRQVLYRLCHLRVNNWWELRIYLVGKIPWRRERLPTPVFWPREFHGLHSPWGRKQSSDTTERPSFSLSLVNKWGKNDEIRTLPLCNTKWSNGFRQWSSMVPDVRKTETKKTYAAFGGGTQYCLYSIAKKLKLKLNVSPV